eukprot:1147683-Pelagomonas_calceolata.AAC.1
MKVNTSKDCIWRVEDRYGTIWEEALERERRGPENKEAYLSRREQTRGCTHLKGACCSSCTSSWACHVKFTKVAGRRHLVIPSIFLNFKSVDAKMKPGHTAHDVFGQAQPGATRGLQG